MDITLTKWIEKHSEFSTLRNSFDEETTVEMILSTPINSLLKCVEGKKRPILSFMVQKMESDQELVEEELKDHLTCEKFYVKGETLMLESHLLPHYVAENNRPSYGEYTTQDLKSCFSYISKNLKVLDISSNHLVDKDFSPVVEFVTECMPNCREVNCKRNRFYGTGTDSNFMSELELLINLPSIEFINIANNQFATSINKDFFHNLQPIFCEKLIWIIEPVLDEPIWKQLAGNNNIEIIANTHRKYYHKKLTPVDKKPDFLPYKDSRLAWKTNLDDHWHTDNKMPSEEFYNFMMNTNK